MASKPEPLVRVKVTRNARSGGWLLHVPECPFCGSPHNHGGGGGQEPVLGWPLSHCRSGSRIYRLVAITEAE
jgi:hypothetical protein